MKKKSKKWKSSLLSMFSFKKKKDHDQSSGQIVEENAQVPNDASGNDGLFSNSAKSGSTANTNPGHGNLVPENMSLPYHQWTSWPGALRCLAANEASRMRCPIGLLEVNIIEAFDLPASDLGLSSDPYCVVTLTGYWSHGQEWPKSMRSILETSRKTQTLYPKWDASVKFYVPRAGAVLRLEVFDQDAFKVHDPLGYVEVPLEALLDNNKVEPWLKLKVAQPFAGKIKKLHKDKKLPGPFDHRELGSDQKSNLAAAGADEESHHTEEHREAHRRSRMFSNYLGAVSKSARIGEHACIHVSLKFDYAPLGDALTSQLWPEDEYTPHDTTFNLDKTLTELFKTLRLIRPIIDFFVADDETGLVDEWNWQKDHKGPTMAALPRSGFWLVFLCVLYKKYPWAIWSFFQAYVVFISWRQYNKRKANIVQFRLGRALKKMINVGPDDPVPIQLAKEVGLTRVYIAGAPNEIASLEAEEKAKEASTAEKELDKDKDGGNGSIIGTMNSSGFSIDGNAVVGLGADLSTSFASITKQVESSLSVVRPEPAFWGRPPNHWSEEPFNDAVPVFYDSDEEQESFVNWIPEDHYIDCKFELDGIVGDLVDRLLGMLRAPWMDTVQNLLMKINGSLDTIHSLLDWRDPPKCKMFAGVCTASAILHLFVPFNMFLYALHIFLFTYFTPVFKYGVTVLLLPINLPKRLITTRRIRKVQPPLAPGASPSLNHEVLTQLANGALDEDDDSGDDDDDDDNDDGGVYVCAAQEESGQSRIPDTEAEVKAALAPGGVPYKVDPLLAKLLMPDEVLELISIRKAKKSARAHRRRLSINTAMSTLSSASRRY